MNGCLNKEYSDQELSDLKSKYINNKPFNHIIIDDFLNRELLEKALKKIDEILLDDLNTPGFIAKIHELYNDASKGDKEKKIKFNNACKLIGLFGVSKKIWENNKKSKINVTETYIMSKIEERSKAKNNGNFSLADKIRDELLSKGILIEDQKGKTIWKYK